MRTSVVGVRFEDSVLDLLRARARAEERSVSTLAGMLIKTALTQQPASPGAATHSVPAAVVPAERRPVAAVSSATPPADSPETPADVRVAGIIATIAMEVRQEQGRPLRKPQIPLRRLIATVAFRDVVNLRTARAKGPAAWVDADAGPGLVRILFPEDRAAVDQAFKRQNRIQMDKRIAASPPDHQFTAENGIRGQGAVKLQKLLAEHFPGLSPEEAHAKGSEAWLQAGVSPGVARELFGHAVGDEAQRRATARTNARRREKTAALT